MPRKDLLRDAGYIRLPGDARRYLSPKGKEVSYRAAFKAARGISLEEAIKVPNKFRPSYRLAEQTRNAALLGYLSKTRPVKNNSGKWENRRVISVKDEKKIAKMSLKEIAKGNYIIESHDSKTGRWVKPKRETPPNPIFEKIARILRSKDNSPDGAKARYLVAIGRRRPDADYDVGDTPN